MQTHEVKSTTKFKKEVRIGRGGKRGKTSGRGTKGQGARAGNKKRPEFRDIIKKLPKLRGYKFNSRKTAPTVVTFEFIEKVFNAGDIVSPYTLADKGVSSTKGHMLSSVKILNRGTLSKALTFEHCHVSKAATDVITKAGGTVKPVVVRVIKKEKGGTSGKPKNAPKKVSSKKAPQAE
jgi:large subunit ribosomal protein L15